MDRSLKIGGGVCETIGTGGPIGGMSGAAARTGK